jgi:hypothetical protein
VNPDGIITDYELGIIYQSAEDLKRVFGDFDLASYLRKSHNCIDFVKKNHDHLALGRMLLSYLN